MLVFSLTIFYIASAPLSGHTPQEQFAIRQLEEDHGDCSSTRGGEIAYKAEGAGRLVIAVNAQHTSQRCCVCGHVSRANRVDQATFRCRQCGHRDHADINAAVIVLPARLAQHPGAKSKHSGRQNDQLSVHEPLVEPAA